MTIWDGVPYQEVVRHCIGIALEEIKSGGLEEIARKTKLDSKPIPENDVRLGIDYLLKKKVLNLVQGKYSLKEGYTQLDCR